MSVAASVALVACGDDGGETASAVPAAAPSAAPIASNAPPVAAPIAPTAAPSTSAPVPLASTAPQSSGSVAAAQAAPAADAELDAYSVALAFQDVLNRAYLKVLPSVVQVRTSVNVGGAGSGQNPFGFRGQGAPDDFVQQGEGSGFVWDERGYILTNNHVVADSQRVTVVFADGSEFEAQVVGADADSDLAVLKIDPPAGGLSSVELGDSNKIKVGHLALALGSPFGQEYSLSTGIVSALGRTIQSGPGTFTNPQIIQTDAALNPGNSGGPLLNVTGQVIGINTQIVSQGGGSVGIGFAVPINTAKRVVPALIEDGEYRHAFVGIFGANLRPDVARAMGVSEETRGVLVVQAIEGGPAERAGLRGGNRQAQIQGVPLLLGGDIIVTIDGTPLRSMDELVTYTAENNRPGDKVTLEVLRDGRQVVVELTLGERPTGP